MEELLAFANLKDFADSLIEVLGSEPVESDFDAVRLPLDGENEFFYRAELQTGGNFIHFSGVYGFDPNRMIGGAETFYKPYMGHYLYASLDGECGVLLVWENPETGYIYTRTKRLY